MIKKTDLIPFDEMFPLVKSIKKPRTRREKIALAKKVAKHLKNEEDRLIKEKMRELIYT